MQFAQIGGTPSQSFGIVGAGMPMPVGGVGSILNSLSGIISRLQDSAARIDAVGNDLFGYPLQSAPSASGGMPPEPAISVELLISRLASVAGQIEAGLARF
jgi:hypothetical protein